jgi:hypothetical protein
MLNDYRACLHRQFLRPWVDTAHDLEGDVMTDYTGKNGIQVTVNDDHKSAIVKTFLDGKYETWIEFDAEQLDGLIHELTKARAALGEKKDG